jgi:predicted RNase H-like HicB family nuclease
MDAVVSTPFERALDAVDQLPPADQEAVLEIVRQRQIARRRTEIASHARDTVQALRDNQAGYGPADEVRGSMKENRAIYLSLILETNEDGYLASAPGLQGAFAEGDTVEEALFNCVDVVKLIAAYRSERGESLGFNAVELTPETRLTVALPVGVA